MRTNYPVYYKGPKAGGSNDDEWLAIAEFQVFKWIRDGTWLYSDFDCWLVARDRHHHKLGEENSLKALQEFQKMYNIKAEVKEWVRID